MPVHYCRPFISAARQTAYGALTYASRRLQGQRQRQGQGHGQERGSTGHQRRAACWQKPRPKRQLNADSTNLLLAQRFQPRRDTDAISHDKANPRLGPVRGLGSLTNCAHPASEREHQLDSNPPTPRVRDNGRRLKLHEEKKASDAGAILRKCTLEVWVAWFCYFDG